jgi:exodeoxyribonuclease VII small subunit
MVERGAGSADGPPATGYAAAMRELEELLADLEDDALDIDLLGAKVARASELIGFCRTRINAARVQVDRIVADLDPASDAADDTGENADDDEPDLDLSIDGPDA